MKKLAFLIFIAAITIGICISYATGSVAPSRSWINFSFGRGVKGSGNVKAETRDLPKFTNIDLGNAVEMEITAQKSQNVEIETDDNILPLIATEVKGDTLYISNQQRISWCSPVSVKISMDQLDGLNVSGAAKVNAANIRSDNFKLDISGASKVKLNGEAGNLNAEASGASRIDAENLRSAKVRAEASGASKVIVSASESIDAKASGASNVTYSGNPANVNKKSSGASSVTQN